MRFKNQIVIILGILISVSGCALTTQQREASSRFATASAEIGDFAASEFTHLREATIDMNAMAMAIESSKNDQLENRLEHLDGAFKPDRVIERVKSAQALSDYGKLLSLLVNETQQDELRQASNNFVDSFRSVGGNKLSDAQYEGLGQLVQEIGTIWVEADKADAVKMIVPAASGDVDRLCDLLINDFDLKQLGLAMGFDATYTNLNGAADNALKDTDISFENRSIISDAKKKAKQEQDYLGQISSQAIKTLTQMKAANSQLKAALENDLPSIEDIKALGTEVNALKTAVMALSGKQ